MTPIPDMLEGLPHVRPKIELAERFSNNVDAPTRAILEDIVKGMDQLWDISVQIYVNKNLTERPWQEFQIKAADLSSSDDPDGNPVVRSVLQTASNSPNEFNWWRCGGLRNYKVELGPGDGVPKHDVIIDRDDSNLGMGRLVAVGDASVMVSTNVARPYGGGTQLQFGEWRPAGGKFKFWPSSLSVDTWVYLEQDLPMAEFQ